MYRQVHFIFSSCMSKASSIIKYPAPAPVCTWRREKNMVRVCSSIYDEWRGTFRLLSHKQVPNRQEVSTGMRWWWLKLPSNISQDWTWDRMTDAACCPVPTSASSMTRPRTCIRQNLTEGKGGGWIAAALFSEDGLANIVSDFKGNSLLMWVKFAHSWIQSF